MSDQENHDLSALSQSTDQYLSSNLARLIEMQSGKIYDAVLDKVEKPLLEAILRECRNNQSKSAKKLGISRGTLRKKLKYHGLMETTPADAEVAAAV